jgi:hypothetical protein
MYASVVYKTTGPLNSGDDSITINDIEVLPSNRYTYYTGVYDADNTVFGYEYCMLMYADNYGNFKGSYIVRSVSDTL